MNIIKVDGMNRVWIFEDGSKVQFGNLKMYREKRNAIANKAEQISSGNANDKETAEDSYSGSIEGKIPDAGELGPVRGSERQATEKVVEVICKEEKGKREIAGTEHAMDRSNAEGIQSQKEKGYSSGPYIPGSRDGKGKRKLRKKAGNFQNIGKNKKGSE